MARLEMQVFGLPDSETDMLNPDSTKVGEVMGIRRESVYIPEESARCITTYL
ncbi:thiamine pyrophosphate-dependent enzyme [Sphingobacterium pedocola]|uniref:hypothetical protein n=1 Tax=Sphingobacterium pedocola TaxID=2082722 RepID=UPI0018CA989C|nr:hypothetical protein [Sphingobacterium pedocola]